MIGATLIPILLATLAGDPSARAAIEVGVASTSQTKIAAVRQAFEQVFPGEEVRIHTFAAKSGVANQPVSEHWGVTGARNRLRSAKQAHRGSSTRVRIAYWVSLENYIEPIPGEPEAWIDRAAIIIQETRTGRTHAGLSGPAPFPTEFAEEARARGRSTASGYSVTSGQVIRDHYLERRVDLPRHDWHQHPDFGGVSRERLLSNGLVALLNTARDERGCTSLRSNHRRRRI